MAGQADRLPEVTWHSGNHTNALVPFYVRGNGADLLIDAADEHDPVRGPYLDNAEMGAIIQEIMTSNAVSQSTGALTDPCAGIADPGAPTPSPVPSDSPAPTTPAPTPSLDPTTPSEAGARPSGPRRTGYPAAGTGSAGQRSALARTGGPTALPALALVGPLVGAGALVLGRRRADRDAQG